MTRATTHAGGAAMTTSKTPGAIGPILIASLLGVLIAAAAAGAIFWHEGYRLYAVRTGSMSPTFPTGSLILDRPVDHDLPSVGTVITFRVNGALVTHRVHAGTPQGLTTKGDANDSPDAWTIGRRLVVGQVAAGVDRGGYVLVFLQQPTAVPALALIAVSVTLAWTLFFGAPPKPDEPVSERVDGDEAPRRVPWPSVTATGVVALLLGAGAVVSTVTVSATTQPTSAYFTSSRAMSMAFSLCPDGHSGHDGPGQHTACTTRSGHDDGPHAAPSTPERTQSSSSTTSLTVPSWPTATVATSGQPSLPADVAPDPDLQPTSDPSSTGPLVSSSSTSQSEDPSPTNPVATGTTTVTPATVASASEQGVG